MRRDGPPAGATVATGPTCASKSAPATPRTLCLDIGGSGLKSMVLDATGRPLTDRQRIETPRPATPEAVVSVLAELVRMNAEPFERVSVGFPGVVVDGVVRTAPNLDGDWNGFDLRAAVERLTQRPTRVANDADVQGLGVIEGQGVEMVLTLGTGLGSALFVDGKLVPNLELGHLPFGRKGSYEDYVDDRTLKRIGRKKWSRRVREVIDTLAPIFNWRVLYLGGGNAKKIKGELPDTVRIVDNAAGLTGGLALWRD
ncbi:MAG: ROK family protein [Myxococcota bacterium]|nr:ROK family protein [Myxococcota bacterium]